jgi:prophage antirepressor-like protein
MSAIEVFHHGAWELRTLTVDGEPWFVAADVCAALGYSNGRKAIGDHVDDLDKGVTACDTPGGRQNVTIINESGLYALVFGSRLDAAKVFKRWVTAEVLPEIRRTGSYTAPATVPAVMPTHSEALRGWADALEHVERAEARIVELEPAARFATELAGANGDFSVREAAQILDRDPSISTGERRLFTTLKAIAWIDRTGAPYQGQVNAGRLVRKLTTWTHPVEGPKVACQTRITPKGLRALHERLGGTAQLVLLTPPAGKAHP